MFVIPSFLQNEGLSSGEQKPIISNVAQGLRGQHWKLLALAHHLIHSLYDCKIANFVARQATLSNIACQATLAFIAETKLLVYNEFCALIRNQRGPIMVGSTLIPWQSSKLKIVAMSIF